LKQNVVLISQDFNECIQELILMTKANPPPTNPNVGKIELPQKSIFEKYPFLENLIFHFSIEKQVNLYISEQGPSTLRPSALLKMEPEVTYTAKTQNVQLNLKTEFYIYNADLKHYEPLVEEISGSMSYTHDIMRLQHSGN
jgi:hypothetical protein